MPEDGQSVLIEPDDPIWMEYIRSCPEANIFHHPAWMELMHDCYGYTSSIFAVPDDDGKIRAGLPFMEVNSPFTGRRWVSLPFSDYCNPLHRDGAAFEDLTGQLVQVFKSHPSMKMEIRWKLPELKDIQQVSEFVLHTIKLDQDTETVSRRFKRT